MERFASYQNFTEEPAISNVNIITCFVWAILILVSLFYEELIQIPKGLNHTAIIFAVLSLSTGLTASRSPNPALFDFFSLTTGTILQGLVVSAYWSETPPLDVMLIVSLGIFIWLVQAIWTTITEASAIQSVRSWKL